MINNSSYLMQSLAQFNLLNLKFILTPVEKVIFSNNEKKGDMWRGAFGEAFQNLACFYRWEKTDCFSCDKNVNCFYFTYFESDKPHPYVISPYLDSKKIFTSKDELFLDILLIGEAVEHYEKFVRIVEEIGKIGVGIQRGRFCIKEIQADPPINSSNIYDENEQIPSELIINFITPVKLKDKQNGIYFNNISFEIFFKFLMKRIINLNVLYCAGKEFDRAKIWHEKQFLFEKIKDIKCESNTKWIDLDRFSSRQNASLKIGGQLGEIKITGDLTPFYPYLKLGEIIGAGLNTTSGFGKYKII